jgi:hypothetical protein
VKPHHVHRDAPTPQRVAARAQARKTPVNINCDGCGGVIYIAPLSEFRSSLSLHMALARQAMVKHCATTGCAGGRLGLPAAP